MQLPTWLTARNVSWFACLLCLTSLSSSKALQSISIALLGAGALWQLWEAGSLRAFRINRFAWLLAGIFALTLISYFYTENLDQWSRDVKGKLLFCAIPLSLGGMLGFSARQYRGIWYGFILSQSIVAGISLFRYWQNFEIVNEAISKNANIDIIGNMSHIYFGLLLAVSVMLGLYLWLNFRPIWGKWERTVILIISLLNIVFLHILTSRTGLLTFYAGLFSFGGWLSWRKRRIWPILVLLTIMVAAPLLSYRFIPSFKTRVDVTFWDIQQFQPGSQIAADYSLSSRIFAWQTAWEIFLDQPLRGTGIADIEDEMRAKAPEQIPMDKRLSNPHNQYLENAAAFGWLGIIWSLAIIFMAIKIPGFGKNWLAIVFLTMCTTGMVFESLLERQVGICLFCFFVYLLPDFQQIETELSHQTGE